MLHKHVLLWLARLFLSNPSSTIIDVEVEVSAKLRHYHCTYPITTDAATLSS
jgi:hypothetical protein